MNLKVRSFLSAFIGSKKKKTLPSLTIIQQQKKRALVLKGLRGSEGIEQVTGSTRHKIAKDAVSRPSSLTPDQFHSSRCKLQIKWFAWGSLVLQRSHAYIWFWCKKNKKTNCNNCLWWMKKKKKHNLTPTSSRAITAKAHGQHSAQGRCTRGRFMPKKTGRIEKSEITNSIIMSQNGYEPLITWQKYSSSHDDTLNVRQVSDSASLLSQKMPENVIFVMHIYENKPNKHRKPVYKSKDTALQKLDVVWGV